MRANATIWLTAAFVCFGCGGIQREYVWTRETPAMGRRSPTVYVVRINIDRAARTVVWVEDVHDSDGELGRNTETWKGCTFLDDENWECEPFVVNGVVQDHVEMRDGQLRQQYWGEDRRFQIRRRLGRVAF
jgi:hypothetical protein